MRHLQRIALLCQELQERQGVHWSSTVGNPGSAWAVNFLNGNAGVLFELNLFYVRAVRGGL